MGDSADIARCGSVDGVPPAPAALGAGSRDGGSFRTAADGTARCPCGTSGGLGLEMCAPAETLGLLLLKNPRTGGVLLALVG